MRYRGVIFDLDGVICFTDKYHYQAWKQLADRLGIPFDETINNRLRGVSRMESLEIILEKYNGPALSAEEKKKLTDEKNKTYQKLLDQMSPTDLSTEVKQTLDTLKERGFLLAIGSSSKNAPLILRQIGLSSFFDAVVDGNQITHSKPNPEVFLLAAEKLGLSPGLCLVVEDAESGIEAAIRGGFKAAGIGPAATATQTTYPLHTLAQLPSLLGAPT